MTTTPVLAMPNFTKPFVIESDVNGIDIWAVLLHEEWLIAYISKALAPRKQGFSPDEKELWLVHAIDEWHTYLNGSHFVIRTNYYNL